jgi:ADP-ribose pyrophosphatase YjhB (NUDIX family)
MWASKGRCNISLRRYPSHPIPGVGALIIQGDAVLLVERGREPLKGYWSLPGGAVETGEALETALRREVKEETGLDVDVLGLVEVFERVTLDQAGAAEYHYILMDYVCRVTGGDLCAADDACRARWFPRHEVAGLHITPGTPAVIEKAFDWVAANARN